MYVCMNVCMYACMYVCMYVRTYVRTSVCLSVCLPVCMYVCMYVWMYECINVWTCKCMNVWMFVCLSFVCLFVCLHVGMYVWQIDFFDTFWCRYHGSYLIIIGLICPKYIIYMYTEYSFNFLARQSSNFQQYVSSRQNLWMNRSSTKKLLWTLKFWGDPPKPIPHNPYSKAAKPIGDPPHWWCHFPQTSNFVRSSCDAVLWVLIGTMTWHNHDANSFSKTVDIYMYIHINIMFQRTHRYSTGDATCMFSSLDESL